MPTGKGLLFRQGRGRRGLLRPCPPTLTPDRGCREGCARTDYDPKCLTCGPHRRLHSHCGRFKVKKGKCFREPLAYFLSGLGLELKFQMCTLQIHCETSCDVSAQHTRCKVAPWTQLTAVFTKTPEGLPARGAPAGAAPRGRGSGMGAEGPPSLGQQRPVPAPVRLAPGLCHWLLPAQLRAHRYIPAPSMGQAYSRHSVNTGCMNQETPNAS